MRRRLLSLCLVLCMVLGMLPVIAMAAEPDQITVTAGEAAFGASYVGAGGKTSFGKNGDVYAVKIPGETEVTISSAGTEAGNYTAANVSGGLLVSFQEYPLELTVEELSKCILTDAEKASCNDVGIDLSLGNWACIILSDGAQQQYLFLLLGDAGVMAADAAEITVADNVIDITDKQIYKWSSSSNVTATSITVSGANVVSATEDGTTVNVLLDEATAADAEVSVVFGASVGSGCAISGHTGTVTLENGTGTLILAVKGYYSRLADRYNATVNYTVNFNVDVAPTEVPARLVETDTKEVYTGVAEEISLKDYFSGAKTYYLVEGETLTELEGKTYTFTAAEGGTHILTFAAGNVVGISDYVTITVEATEIKSGTWIGYETSNGSMDYVLFTDANGNPIEGLTASVEGQTINVNLPQTFAVDGSITATFGLTQNGDYPFLSTKTATAGVSSGKAVNNKFTAKSTTLSNGEAVFTFYYFNTAPTGSNQITWKINYKIFNNIPSLVEGAATTDEQTITAAADTYTVDLSALFTDADGQDLTYKVSINDGAYAACEANYSFNTNLAGTYILKFRANDGQDDSAAIYTVTLTVENSDETFAVPISVADSVESLTFYADSLSGQVLTYEGGSIQVPVNVKSIWWKTESGMTGTAAVENGTSLALQLTTFVVKTALEDVDTGATVTVTDPDGNTVSGNGFVYLLDSGSGYTFKAAPGTGFKNGWAVNALTNQTVTTDLTATVEIILSVNSPKTITIDKGAELHVYYQSKYFVMTEVHPVFNVDNGDTITYTYSCPNQDTYKMGYLYFARKDGLIDKAGYLSTTSATVVSWKGDTRTGSYRADYDRSTTFGARADDSVIVNVNSRNHLVLNQGATFRLRSWRIWEIINTDTFNVMIEPEYRYTRYGSDIFTLANVTDKVCGTGGNNWVDMTVTGSGVAFLEVGYEAVHIVDGYGTGAGVGGSSEGQVSNFTYNASDPARTALIVVQTDGNSASDVTFGIKNNNGGTWDAEFDTLYFTGSHGQLTFTPSATSGIGSVAVSNDKGESFTELTADENGVYTAPIVSGANVIRITNGNGQTAYQVVRGDKITVTITNVTSGKDADAAIEPGDTVSIQFDGLHFPVGKMSGVYNGNAHQIAYMWNGAKVIMSDYAGYNLPGYAHIEVTVPTEAIDSYTLTGGYITFTSMGDPFGNHRNLTDNGAEQQTMAEKKYGNMSCLPDIEIPVALPEYNVTLTEGEGYTITAAEGSESPVKQGGSFSFTVTVSDGYEGTPVVTANDTVLETADGVYTIENITADQTVTVTGIEKVTPVYGNMDGDGDVDVFDAAFVYGIVNGTTEATQEQLACADVNADGVVNVFDAALLYSYVNGKLSSFPGQN